MTSRDFGDPILRVLRNMKLTWRKPSGIDRDSANMREGNAPFADSALH